MKADRDELRTHLDRIYAGGQFPAAAFASDLSARGLSESQTTYVIAPPFGGGTLEEGVGVVSIEDLRNAVSIVGRDSSTPVNLWVGHDEDLVMKRVHVDEVMPGRETWSAQAKEPGNLGTYLPPDQARQMRDGMAEGTAVRLPEWLVKKARKVDGAFGQGNAQITAKPGEVALRIGDPFHSPQVMPFDADGYEGPECEVLVRSGTLADVLGSQPEDVGVEMVLLDAEGEVGVATEEATRVIGFVTDDEYYYGITKMTDDRSATTSQQATTSQ